MQYTRTCIFLAVCTYFIRKKIFVSQSLLLEKENLEAKVDILRNLSSKVVLPGSMFDCIVFHDGESWRYGSHAYNEH